MSTDRVHDLKVWPQFFDALADRSKTFEVRPDDRGVQVGDWLLLREWNPTTGYTGRKLLRWVTYVLRGPEGETFGLRAGYCALGLARDETEATRPRD